MALVALLGLACGGERADDTGVEVLRVAPRQLLGDSLEFTPSLGTEQDAPEQGRIALSIGMHVRNAGGTVRRVPTMWLRAVAESGRDTAARWRHEITPRPDSLRPGQGATFGVTTSPGVLATGSAGGGVYRIEAVLGDSTMDRRTLPLGRIRLRTPVDST